MYFFTSDEYDLYFFTVANRGVSTILGFISVRNDLFPNDLERNVLSDIMLRTYACQIKQMTSYFDVTFELV